MGIYRVVRCIKHSAFIWAQYVVSSAPVLARPSKKSLILRLSRNTLSYVGQMAQRKSRTSS